jgi:hypothetical protein
MRSSEKTRISAPLDQLLKILLGFFDVIWMRSLGIEDSVQVV